MRETIDVDVDAFETFLARLLGRPTLRLTVLPVKCAWPVFKGESAGSRPVFVKFTTPSAAQRALALLTETAACEFLPKPVWPKPIHIGSRAVICLQWLDGVCVNPEDMTEAQADAFLEGCVRLSEILSPARNIVDLAPEDDPVRQYEAVTAYARRHPLVGRLLKDLVSIPTEARTFGPRPQVPIHGDLQPKNYGFDGDRFAAVFDLDDATRGLACEDPAYAFAERARKSWLGDAKRTRLTALFLRMVERSPWPWEDWLFALNHCRLRIASRRLRNHPCMPFVAVDIARRDKPLRRLVAALTDRFGRGRGELSRKP